MIRFVEKILLKREIKKIKRNYAMELEKEIKYTTINEKEADTLRERIINYMIEQHRSGKDEMDIIKKYEPWLLVQMAKGNKL